jgi:hypothetical protein
MFAPIREYLRLRFPFALALSAGILGSLLAVAGGSVCKPTGTFNFVSSITILFVALFEEWYIVIPVVVLFALVIVPFAPRGWSRRSVTTVIAVPIVIYVLLGGGAAYDLYLHPVTGCF